MIKIYFIHFSLHFFGIRKKERNEKYEAATKLSTVFFRCRCSGSWTHEHALENMHAAALHLWTNDLKMKRGVIYFYACNITARRIIIIIWLNASDVETIWTVAAPVASKAFIETVANRNSNAPIDALFILFFLCVLRSIFFSVLCPPAVNAIFLVFWFSRTTSIILFRSVFVCFFFHSLLLSLLLRCVDVNDEEKLLNEFAYKFVHNFWALKQTATDST